MERCVSSSSEKSDPHGLLVMVLLSLPCCISISVLLKVFYPKKKKKGKLVNRTKLRFDMKEILDLHPKKKKNI